MYAPTFPGLPSFVSVTSDSCWLSVTPHIQELASLMNSIDVLAQACTLLEGLNKGRPKGRPLALASIDMTGDRGGSESPARPAAVEETASTSSAPTKEDCAQPSCGSDSCECAASGWERNGQGTLPANDQSTLSPLGGQSASRERESQATIPSSRVTGRKELVIEYEENR